MTLGACQAAVTYDISAIAAAAVDETDLFVDNERSISVNSTNLIQALPTQLQMALAQQQQQQSCNTTATGSSRGPSNAGGAAGGAEEASPVSAAAAAAAVQTVRKLIKQNSSRSRDRGSSGGGVQYTTAAAAAAGRSEGGYGGHVGWRDAATGHSGAGGNNNQLSEPLLGGDEQT